MASISDIDKMETDGNIDGLIDALTHPSRSVRIRAARSLGKFKAGKALAALLAVRKSEPSQKVKQAVEEALNCYSKKKHIDHIATARAGDKGKKRSRKLPIVDRNRKYKKRYYWEKREFTTDVRNSDDSLFPTMSTPQRFVMDASGEPVIRTYITKIHHSYHDAIPKRIISLLNGSGIAYESSFKQMNKDSYIITGKIKLKEYEVDQVHFKSNMKLGSQSDAPDPETDGLFHIDVKKDYTDATAHLVLEYIDDRFSKCANNRAVALIIKLLKWYKGRYS